MIIKNGRILSGNDLIFSDVLISFGKIEKIASDISQKNEEVFDANGSWIIPAGVDVHVHLREPGFTSKETIYTGTKSAAKGGITTVMAMPNLKPVPDCLENLGKELTAIQKDAGVNVYPYAALTIGEKGEKLSDIKNLSKLVLAFSDDGCSVENPELLKLGMEEVKKYNRIICSHAERKSAADAKLSEIQAVKEELELVRKTGVKYHFCHLSTKESFDMIRRAKAEGLNVSAEVTPHHLFLNEEQIKGNSNFKMNPPLRSEEDRRASINALLDGAADFVATDHAPHSIEEKEVSYDLAPNGIIGLETMLPLLYTNLIKTNMASYSDFIKWTSGNAINRFGIPKYDIKEGNIADITLLDIDNKRVYEEKEILSKASNSPFIGLELYGFPILTLWCGNIVYKRMQGGKE